MKEETNEKSETITISKNQMWKYSTFVLAALVVVLAFVAFNGERTGNVVNNPPAAPTAQAITQPTTANADADDDPVLGNKNAPVEIIEFSDYQCPFCRKFWTETLPSIKTEYIDTGKVKFVYRDFPLTSIHPSAEPAAEAGDRGWQRPHVAAGHLLHERPHRRRCARVRDAGRRLQRRHRYRL